MNTHLQPCNVLFCLIELILGSLDFHLEKKTSLLVPHTSHKSNSRWTVALNVNDKTKKLLGKNIEEYLHVLGVSKDLSEDTNTNEKGKF